MAENTTQELQSYTLNKAFFYYAVKKTERLARAVYLITNFFSESEPLKWKLRSDNLTLLEYFSILADSIESERSIDLSFIKNSLSTILATLGVAHTAGLISEMNFSVLRQEYETLLNALEDQADKEGKHDPVLFPQNFFNVSEERQTTDSLEKYLFGIAFENRSGGKLESSASNKVQGISSPEKEKTENAEESSKGQKTNQKDIKDNKKTKIKRTQLQPSTLSKTQRRDIIIQLVKDKKEITVKDAAREIQDCSEKTLQREIVGMVEEGVLERLGSRRWSRYRLNSSS
ncbi:MAG: hypothetical protein U5L75_02570 [Candidatus Campbellbacteria bacterium]|nr:hypothetical protein [Candidatus Campbellbacteria bacterium]